MATIPEEPHTDLEQYLNRLATGEGEYPAEPHTNVEQYLNYMIENGLGGGELVTELPPEGKDGKLYVLVDDAEHPTKAYGVYTYAGGQYVLVAQPVDQSVKLVTELPETGEEGVLYYLEIDESGATDTYDLYRWLNNGWVKVDTDIILYSGTGQNVDGAMTQKAVTDAISNISGVKTLTSADVNYPANAPTKISLYSLNYGIYKIIGPVSIVFGNASTSVQSGFDRTAVVMPGNGTYKTIGWGYNVKDLEWKNVYSDTGSSASEYTGTISDSLNYSSAEHPLSAKQGKVLNEKIGDLSTLTTTAKTSAVAAINELDSDKEGKTITGSAAPTTSTVADNIGQKYYDSTNDKWYVCKAITPGVDPDPTTYTWEEQAGGPTVVQEKGSSTTDVMSQNATTDLVYKYITKGSGTLSAGGYAIAIGDNAKAAANRTGSEGWYNSILGIAIGQNADSSFRQPVSGARYNGLAIGQNAKAGAKGIYIGGFLGTPSSVGESSVVIDYTGQFGQIGAETVIIKAKGENSASSFPAGGVSIGGYAKYKGSIALGLWSKPSAQGVASIGLENGTSAAYSDYGYNNSAYRLLTGLYDPQSAHDAANKQYVDANSATTLTISQFNSILENA